jgi:hypothetical protein
MGWEEVKASQPPPPPLHLHLLLPFKAVLRIRTINDRIQIRIRLLQRSDPDPSLNKFSAKFLMKNFFGEKVEQKEFLKYLGLLHTPKKFI